jgi:hypothetical protein
VFIENPLVRPSKNRFLDYKFKEIISKHLFQTEKVSQYQFGNEKLKETILGTKMAGFKQPVYEILAFSLQSFRCMIPAMNFLKQSTTAPCRRCPRDYNYKLLDTIAINGRMSYMIYFKK